MDSGLTLERELLHLLGTGRNAGIAARYYGFDGRGGCTLRTVGNEIGLTAERVRQIVTAASQWLSTQRPVSPTLDRTIAFVVDHMPAAAGRIETQLQSQRLASGLFRLEGVIKAAELLRRRLPFSITALKGERLVHSRDIASLDTIVPIVRRLMSRWGLATLSDVVAKVRKVRSDVCARKALASALACLGDFHWLEQSTGWFWLSGTPNNPVLNRIREILSVTNPIHISELKAGIGRDYRMWGFSPPKRVFLEFCRQAPWLRVNDETVHAEAGVNSDDDQPQTERDIVHIMSEHGGTMAAPKFRSKLTLERELCDLLGTGRNAFIADRYYGFDGRGGTTLQAIGNEIGVTRERVRQIISAASESLSTRRPASPTLDRTIAFVVDHMPGAAGRIETQLQSQRLTSGLFRLEGVIKAAELLRRRLPFSITALKGERLVHSRDIASLDTIVRIAQRLMSRWGLTTLSDVVAEVRKLKSDVCTRKVVASALACLGDFHWLEQSTGWFWLSGTPNNPLLNRIRKILSVANPIHISELRAGIARDSKMKVFSPPKRVLLEFCRQAPGLRVNNETVRAGPVISADDALAQTERDIVHILTAHGGTMATSEFKSVCLGMGVNRNTFYQNLLRSPIISRYANHLYGLIGASEMYGRRDVCPARKGSYKLLRRRPSAWHLQ